MHMYIYTYTHIHTHMYIHACIPECPPHDTRFMVQWPKEPIQRLFWLSLCVSNQDCVVDCSSRTGPGSIYLSVCMRWCGERGSMWVSRESHPCHRLT